MSEDDYEGDFSVRLEALEAAVYNAESDAAAARKDAERWAIECEYMLKRITALEDAVERLKKPSGGRTLR